MGLDVAGDPKLVFSIRKGRAPRPRMEARIAAYMDSIDRETAQPSRPTERGRRPR
jgi:hypothetical protein